MIIASPEQCERIHEDVVRSLVESEGRRLDNCSFGSIYTGPSVRDMFMEVIVQVESKYPIDSTERKRLIEEMLAFRREELRRNQFNRLQDVNNYARAVTGELLKLPQDVCKQIYKEAVEIAHQRFQKAQVTKASVARKGGLFPLLDSPEKIVNIYGANTVILLSGLCGSGKSTLVKKMIAKLNNHRIWVLETDTFYFPRLVSKTLAEVIEIDPDEFLGVKDWEGEVPASTVEPSMGLALDKLTKVLEKSGIVVIVDAGDNRGQREAILRHVRKIRPVAHIHYVFVDCPPVESLARNKSRKRMVSDKAWLDVLYQVKDTFTGLRKFIVKEYGGTWETVDVSSTKYHQLLDELYQCAHTAVPATFGNKRCEHIVTPTRIAFCDSKLVLPRWDWVRKPNVGFLCPAHFPRKSGHFVLTS